MSVDPGEIGCEKKGAAAVLISLHCTARFVEEGHRAAMCASKRMNSSFFIILVSSSRVVAWGVERGRGMR